MRPTLQTVADAVGVSRSTVSNAYSRPDQLSADLRDRILSAAADLGYAGPDPTARSLRKRRAGAIGVLFTATLSYAFTDPYAVQYLRGLAGAAEEGRTGLLLLPLSMDDEEAAVAAVNDAVVDGFCVYCMPEWHPALAAIQARGLPVVAGQRRPEDGPQTSFVGIDEAAATRAAGDHLVALGHRRLAVLGEYFTVAQVTGPARIASPGDVPYYSDRERLRGYAEALASVGVPWSAVSTVNAARNGRAEGAAAAAQLLDRAPRPTAIAALSDILALGVLDAVRARGLRPGHDISIVGFDDIPDAATEGLTTVHQPAAERGRRSGLLLLDPPTDPADRTVVLPTKLVVRATTGPAPS
ncbi:LacI family DNA-binding transcriptional regulator [Asanoa sp. WMMD1127]|uniref:LacI family DNA-binding transcriptional regulator n=1 Tax=Asanoa sp. WMMD1127 TaxID=3016107 RepID=UPI0024163753|nr:LacI family DNA-binding transcriptional regulator [Asanoa sp. WMMD1127]MDG4824799.1 LacI family DNA-binding transcriptional regulator [Asanoa sp. WMMD1127]